MSDPANGRPTQFHAVPLDERAVDSQGRTLPWALEWHEDHPNARHQKRQPEEKGPFGKSTGRNGSSRIRTTTPAKKENPTMDAFELAMKHDLQKNAEEARLQSIASSRAQNDGSITSHHPPPSMYKEPTQAILYGFSPSTQWAAISFYENVSSGMICEDYERGPPSERRKFPNQFSTAANIRPRALTKAESVLSRQYSGGKCWIKVTFDSAEAAERAIYYSPHLLQGHWVYAQLFHGAGPEVDEPIPMREEDRGGGLHGASRHAHRPSQTLGSSFAQNSVYSRGGANTFSRSFNGNTTTEAEAQPATGPSSPSSSATASSATATGPTVDYPDLRNRHSKQPSTPTMNNNSNDNITRSDGQAATLEPSAPARNPHFFTHFPDVPRTVLRPSQEAFLPHPTWFEATMARLSGAGWLPGDMIGEGVPRLENGNFDWTRASLYWKVFYWIDSHLGTDFCGMKDE
ncbi:hypothetical protein MMC07_005833 [Pseudocyphellaria aurata]|nr:hypothetical protein [Pseudocyphellaria aurata]